mmetsp:Transcript_41753/g.110127  ORF Transcript_41753/g.110127 Transcript_41753/m.110127 type:complete len:244 (+) Transcript_41753:123-854(+)
MCGLCFQRKRELVTLAKLALQVHWRAQAAQPPKRHDPDAVAKCVCLLHGVCRQHHATAPCDVGDDSPQDLPRFRVKACRGLVQEDDARIRDERDAQRQTPPHAARELRRLHAEWVAVQSDGLGDLASQRPFLVPGHALDAREEEEVLEDSEVLPDNVELWANAQNLVDAPHLGARVEASNPGLPASDALAPRQHRDDGRLAGAVWPEEAEARVRGDAEGDALHGLVATRVLLHQVAHLDGVAR